MPASGTALEAWPTLTPRGSEEKVVMRNSGSCPVCGGPLPPYRGGRPRLHCGLEHRRRAGFATRRLDKLAAHMDRVAVELAQLLALSEQEQHSRRQMIAHRIATISQLERYMRRLATAYGLGEILN